MGPTCIFDANVTMDSFEQIKSHIESLGFEVVAHDFKRPWGGFLVSKPIYCIPCYFIYFNKKVIVQGMKNYSIFFQTRSRQHLIFSIDDNFAASIGK